MLKLAEAIWHSGDNFVDQDAVLELINWNCADCDCENHFQFFGLVMFDLSEGNNYTLSKQFLCEARITLAERSIPSKPRDTADLNQQSVGGQIRCTTARLKPYSES
jgi:hypothetical protein